MSDQPLSGARPLLVQLRFPVKTYDIDFAGHVSNIVYIRWLEDLRLAMLDAYLPLSEQMELGLVPMLVETSIRYRRQVGLFTDVMGSMWVEAMSTVRVTLRAEFTADEEVCAEAHQTGAFIETGTGRPAKVPPEFRKRFRMSPANRNGI